MIERLPERVRTPAVARAVTSPSAVLLAAAGMSAAILGGLPIAAAAVVGAAAWAGRVAFAVPRGAKGERIDPFRVGEPWRRFVQDAQQAENRFADTVQRMKTGPLRERLAGIGARIHDGVVECWRIACQGDALDAALTQLDVQRIQQELAQVDEEQRRLRRDDPGQAALARTRTSVEAQLESARRIDRVARDARDKLRVLNAQLDEAVARAVELSLQGDMDQVSPLTDQVEGLVGDLEAVRQALEETGGAQQTATG